MKKFLYMVLSGALACACTKTEIINDPYESGLCIAEVMLGAMPGSLSFSVETKGEWRVESDQPWLELNTAGRTGHGAFMVRYASNESNALSLKEARTARVTIRLEESMKTDTMVFVQRGLYPVEPSLSVTADPLLTLEYDLPQEKDVVLLCCSSEGTGDVSRFIEDQKADITVVDGKVIGEVSGLNVVGCNFAELDADAEFEIFRSMIQKTYNSGPHAGDDWIYAGQMYHLSVMQGDSEKTPEWYPEKNDDERFRSDVYAWQNNLYDCVWMYVRDYVETYCNTDGKSFCADYVYASASVFAKVASVELIEVEGLAHKAVRLTLKY